MKRLAALCLSAWLALSAAAAEGTEPPVDLEVREKMFLTQIMELNINAADYLGKTVALEGMFMTVETGEGGPVYRLVYRQSPGCCGNDGITGLEVVWDDPAAQYPAENDWVRAVGKLEQYMEEGTPYLQLRLLSLTVLPERGLEFVTQ